MREGEKEEQGRKVDHVLDVCLLDVYLTQARWARVSSCASPCGRVSRHASISIPVQEEDDFWGVGEDGEIDRLDDSGKGRP